MYMYVSYVRTGGNEIPDVERPVQTLLSLHLTVNVYIPTTVSLISPTIRRDLQSHRAGTVVEVYMEERLTSPQEHLAQSAR